MSNYSNKWCSKYKFNNCGPNRWSTPNILPKYLTGQRYLTKQDYLTIQDVQIKQITQNDITRLYRMEQLVMEEASSYLKQRFWVNQEFTPTLPWNPTVSYNPGNRIILDYPCFDHNSAYAPYDCVTYEGKAYMALHNVFPTSPGYFDADQSSPAQWLFLGNHYDMYNAIFPYPEFNINAYYSVGQQVYWNGYIYTCTFATVPVSSESIIQYYVYSNVPELNVFPDDTVNNANDQFWGNAILWNPAPVNSPAPTYPMNTDYWNLGDNRCHQLVFYMIDMVIYYLHRSIAPGQIPEIRKQAYEMAKRWLVDVGKGIITPNLAVLQPTQGLKNRFGGDIALNFRY